MTAYIRQSVPFLLVAFALVAGSCSCDGNKGTDPKNPPSISQFSASPADILPNDPSTLSYAASRADSIKLFPGGQKMTDPASGSVVVTPAIPTLYTLVAYNSDGVDSATVYISMDNAVAKFTFFEADKDTIVTGDSATVTWKADRADSVVFDHGIGKVLGSDSGQAVLKPTISSSFRAVTYNDVGNDTLTILIRVQVPVRINVQNGRYYRGALGASGLQPPLRFWSVNASDEPTDKAWLYFDLLDGDGVLTVDSGQVAASGYVQENYTFSGTLGHAVVQARVQEIDTALVNLRASTLAADPVGQGQFVLVTDTFGVAQAYNGSPASVDEDPSIYLNYAVYEQQLGIVVMVWDDNQDLAASADEEVYGVIVNTVYQGTFPSGLGIGSSYGDIVADFGAPEASFIDPAPPPAQVFQYPSRGLTFFCNTTDSVVFEIHIADPESGSPMPMAASLVKSAPPSVTAQPADQPRRYRLTPR